MFFKDWFKWGLVIRYTLETLGHVLGTAAFLYKLRITNECISSIQKALLAKFADSAKKLQ